MGTSQSREDRIMDSESEEDYEEEEEEEEQYDDASIDHQSTQASSSTSSSGTQKSLDDIDAKLKSLKLKYNSAQRQPNHNLKNPVKLYLHIGGNTPKAKWVVPEKLTSYHFIKTSKINGDDDDGGDEPDSAVGKGESWWVLKVGSKVRARVSTEMQLKMFGDQRRLDFVDKAVWALKFLTDEEYRNFVTKFQD
ncbi:hypothetical protein DITRI_Ditri08aG0111900 [Diplodiscus trichospermus]